MATDEGDRQVVLTIRLPADLRARVRRAASLAGLSMNRFVVDVLRSVGPLPGPAQQGSEGSET